MSAFAYNWSRLFDSITIEHGARNPVCAEGATLPLGDAVAEIKGRDHHYTFGPIVSGPKKELREKERTPTQKHMGEGPCERVDKGRRGVQAKARLTEKDKENRRTDATCIPHKRSTGAKTRLNGTRGARAQDQSDKTCGTIKGAGTEEWYSNPGGHLGNQQNKQHIG